MGMEGPEVPEGAEARAGEGTTHPAQHGASLEQDALYLQALEHVQRGRWVEAEDALAELLTRYPGSVELARLQHELALHLSAERTWLAGLPRRWPKPELPRRPTVRVLLAANLVLYLLVATLWLLSCVRQLVR